MDFIITALAVYRVSRMMAIEKGPFEVFENSRGIIGWWTGYKGWIFEGVGCPLCLSFWTGLAGALLLPHRSITEYISNAMALSGAATILYKMEKSQ